MSTTIKDFLFNMMPDDQRRIDFGDTIGIYDNLDDECDFGSDFNAEEKHAEYLPAKIRFTLGLYCHDGSIDLSANLNDYHMLPGDMMICPSGTIVSDIYFSTDCRIAVFCVSDANAIDRNTSADIGRLVMAMGTGPLHMSLRESFRDALAQHCRMLRLWLSEPDFAMRAQAFYSTLQSMIIMVAASLSAPAEAGDIPKTSRAMQLYRRFLEVVDRNYRENRKLSFYADRCCVTGKYLGKIVHEISGRHPADIIRDHVILEAKAMLRSGHYTVRQVSDELHFANPSFFCRYFRQAVGCSPLHFRG